MSPVVMNHVQEILNTLRATLPALPPDEILDYFRGMPAVPDAIWDRASIIPFLRPLEESPSEPTPESRAFDQDLDAALSTLTMELSR